jgi:hypothetical protein
MEVVNTKLSGGGEYLHKISDRKPEYLKISFTLLLIFCKTFLIYRTAISEFLLAGTNINTS